MARAPRRLLAAFAITTAVLAGSATSCCSRDNGTKPRATALPALALRDDTPDLLLTWLDAKGEFHTTMQLSDVPPEGRAAVRVVVKSLDEGSRGDLIYVADLEKKLADGSYAVRTATRAEWEALADARRRAASLPPEAAPAPGASGPTPRGAPEATRVVVVIYGASWCRPCHDAAAYLRQRGIAFVEKDVEADQGASDEMQRKLESAGKRGGSIPVIDVGGRVLIGFDPSALDAALAQVSRGTTTL
jgi:glutaredoxin